MKKIIALIFSCIFAISLVACGGESPDTVVKNFYSQLKDYNIEELVKSTGLDIDKEQYEKLSQEGKNAVKKFFSSAEVSIKDTKIDGDNATVDVEVTAIDGKEIMSKYISSAFELALSNTTNSKSDEELEKEVAQILINIVNSNDVKKSTQSISIELVKKDGKWEIKDPKNLILETYNFKDISSAIDNLNNK